MNTLINFCAEQYQTNLHLIAEVARLKIELKLALMAKYARSSEKYKSDDKQLNLFDEATLNDLAAESLAETELEEVEEIVEEKVIKVKKKTGRKKLPKYLPRVRKEYELSASELETADGFKFEKIGEEITEELQFIPAKILVIEHVRFKYACKAREEYGIKIAPMMNRAIPQSIASSSLLAHVLVQKYVYHMPLYRQEQQWKEFDIELNRGTLSNWVMKCAEILKPIGEELKNEILSEAYIHADETPVTVLTHGEKENSRKSYMWVYGSSLSRLIYYDYQKSRSGDHAAEFLKSFKGHLQADAYPGYDKLYTSGERKEVGCWAHARRKFHDIIKVSKKNEHANHALKEIKKLYQLEEEIREANTKDGEELGFDEIKNRRQTKSKPILDRFKIWMEGLIDRTPPQGKLGNAISYALKHWNALTEYLNHGHLDIDNNFAENAIRPFALGRKNWLFHGNHDGARAAALIYSIFQSAKANHLKPHEYMTHLLDNIGLATSRDDILALMPHRVKLESLLIKSPT